jgi:hypothetical protein
MRTVATFRKPWAEICVLVLAVTAPLTAGAETPLHKAVRDGAINAIVELIRKGADLNGLNDQTQTPLTLALSLNQSLLRRIRG